ncbi:MAG: arginase family protein [Gemmataceae bacterium]|nr:arginase family protein [Gemmataceae bacterium]MDW8242144.1 arginase family protein [Thermogemmata sp.]
MENPITIGVVIFPFDQFGSAGTSHGAEALAEVVREIRQDAHRESQPCRTHVLRDVLALYHPSMTTPQHWQRWRQRGRRLFQRLRQRHPFILWLGGNHLSVFPVLEQLEPDTLVLQFDAHLDIHAFDQTMDYLSHGNYWRFLPAPLPVVWHLGHRDLFVSPQQTAPFFSRVYSAVDLQTRLPEITAHLHQQVRQSARIWIDIDVDVFDPAICPAVQQPLPFGLTATTFWPLWQVAFQGKVLGVSLSEFDPGRDRQEQSLHMLGWLIESLLLQVVEQQR